MAPLPLIALGVLAGLVSWAAVAGVRRVCIGYGILDVPNERSSHTTPMPTAGGVGIALGVGASLGAVAILAEPPALDLLIVCGISAAFGAVGLVDDTRGVGAVPHLLLQLGLAGLFCWLLGPMPHVDLPFLGLVPLGWAATPLTMIWLLAVTNLFNFFDGIDGIAGGQALLTCGLCAITFFLTGAGGFALVCALVTASTFGFLLHNFPPATIFMGNTGATMIGFFIAAIASLGVARFDIPLLFFVLLLAPCLFDTTYTLALRIARRERWYQAHRCHLYQRLTDAGLSHRQTDTVEYGLMFICGALALWYLYSVDTLRALLLGTAALLMACFALWATRVVRRRASRNARPSAP